MPSSNATDVGVYLVRNRKTGAAYVGASRQMSVRLRRHLSHVLNFRPHAGFPYRPFGGAFADCTEADIELRVLERTTVEALRERELFWIRKLRPSCNVHHTREPIDTAALPVGAPA